MRRVCVRWLMMVAAGLAIAVALACNGDDGGGGATTPSPEGQPSPEVQPSPEASPDMQASPTQGPVLQRCPDASPPSVPATENVLANPGLEDGRDPWFALKPPDFEVSEIAHSGESSAMLRMREEESAAGAKVFYLVQEVLPSEFPEVLSGFYRVEHWLRGTEKQYLQFVAIVFGAANAPEEFPNHQIRYILAGIENEPFDIANAKFVFLSREDAPLGEWIPFEVNVKQDFADLWGAVPEGYQCIRLLYEVRYDDKIPGFSKAEADVLYDDLYFGPAEGATAP